MNVFTFRRGFTLMELLVVIAIMGILATVVYTSVNPARQYAQSRNAQRQIDVAGAGNALAQYRVEHSGSVPAGITSTPAVLSTVSSALVPVYLKTLPMDPKGGEYLVSTDAQNRVVVSAPDAELDAVIEVTQ